MTSTTVTNVLNTLNAISQVAPVIASAAGLQITGVAAALVESLPEIEATLATLLAIFQKHATPIAAANTASLPPAS